MSARPARVAARLDVKLRVGRGPGYTFGPGKADLLRIVAATGSLVAAARQMGMSYAHGWKLVREMNSDFRAPLVDLRRGGGTGGGAVLTTTGEGVLAAFDRAQGDATKAAAAGWRALQRYI